MRGKQTLRRKGERETDDSDRGTRGDREKERERKQVERDGQKWNQTDGKENGSQRLRARDSEPERGRDETDKGRGDAEPGAQNQGTRRGKREMRNREIQRKKVIQKAKDGTRGSERAIQRERASGREAEMGR